MTDSRKQEYITIHPFGHSVIVFFSAGLLESTFDSQLTKEELIKSSEQFEQKGKISSFDGKGS